mmetsp:Transcript_68544/g.137831  ORF Transcript_68544/g.137831 Transcript_68544/m.137831 type:complete len:85 (-) Transcript_68544:404-658(-)
MAGGGAVWRFTKADDGGCGGGDDGGGGAAAAAGRGGVAGRPSVSLSAGAVKGAAEASVAVAMAGGETMNVSEEGRGGGIIGFVA